MIFIETCSYTHPGRRGNQEDALHAESDILIVSDGVGGASRGEVASKIVVEGFRDYYWYQRTEGKSLENLGKEASCYINLCLNNLRNENVLYQGMAATLAAVYRSQNEVYAVHLGDSRIYLFSVKGMIKWKSKDHSLVQQLVDAQLISEEEALFHPQRNVITRVFQATEENKAKPEVCLLTSLEAGDRIILCTDGVLESWKDDELQTLFQNEPCNERLISAIRQRCEKNSADNNTAVVTTLKISNS